MAGPNVMNFSTKVVFLGGNALTLPMMSADPGTAAAGDMYYNTVSNMVRYYNGTAWANVGSAGSVTSVALADTSSTPIYSVSGSPVTMAGTLDLTLNTQTANTVFAGPATGSAAQPTFRALTSADLPSLSYANQTLSNLTSPTAINQNLLPGTTNTFSLGSATLGWASVYTGAIFDESGVSAIAVNNRRLFDSSASASVLFDGRVLAIGSTVMLDWHAAGVLDVATNRIINVTNPTGAQDAATKNYVDTAINGLTWKGPVAAFANSNTALTGGATLTIDGYSVSNGQYVILSNQTTTSQQGVYLVSGIGTAYTLTAATGSEAATTIGDAYLISNGTVYGNTAYQVNALSPTTFIQFAGPNAFSFTSPLSLTGNVVSLGYDNSTLQVTGGNLYVNNAPAGTLTGTTLNSTVVTSSLTSVGILTSGTWNATTIAIAHGGTGQTTQAAAFNALSPMTTLGDTIYGGAAGAGTRLAGSTSATLAVLTQTGTGSVSAAPVWTSSTGTGNVVMSASPTLSGTISAAALNLSGALGANGGITSTGAMLINTGSNALQIESSSFQRSTNGTNYVTETYSDSTTLTDNSGPTAITAFQFTTTNFAGEEITYVIESGDAAADCRIGTIRIVANNSGTIVPSITDMYAESADCGVAWTATNSGGTISVNYTTTNQGANRTMRADIKQFRR